MRPYHNGEPLETCEEKLLPRAILEEFSILPDNTKKRSRLIDRRCLWQRSLETNPGKRKPATTPAWSSWRWGPSMTQFRSTLLRWISAVKTTINGQKVTCS